MQQFVTAFLLTVIKPKEAAAGHRSRYHSECRCIASSQKALSHKYQRSRLPYYTAPCKHELALDHRRAWKDIIAGTAGSRVHSRQQSTRCAAMVQEALQPQATGESKRGEGQNWVVHLYHKLRRTPQWVLRPQTESKLMDRQKNIMGRSPISSQHSIRPIHLRSLNPWSRQ